MSNQTEALLKHRQNLMNEKLDCDMKITELCSIRNDITEELQKIDDKLKDPCDICEEKNFKRDGEGC